VRALKQSEQVQVALGAVQVMQTERVPQVLVAVQMPQMGQILVPQVVLEVPELHFGRFYPVLLSVSESNPC
jgi:hypothetical protein